MDCSLRAARILAAFAALATPAAGQWFHDVAGSAGVDFEHRDGRSGEKYYVETTANGGGWLDFDGDGDLDLYLVNGAATPGSKIAETPRNALYESRGGRFVEVAESVGVADDAYGMGLCVGDVDGRLDFLVTNHGPDRLYRNRGAGSDGRVTFEEIGGPAGVADERWSLGCAFGDLDGDGDLDLYLDFSFSARNPHCRDPASGRRIYCRPDDFDGVADSLYVNQGRDSGGTVIFRDEGAARGIARGVSEKGMGVILSDLDLDGYLDVYVANDGALNRLYVNDGTGRFEDAGLLSGAGLNALGRPEAGMGVDAGDLDADGHPDLIVSHFAMETNTLYKNLGDLQFEDVTAGTGLGPISYKNVGWRIRLLDFDNDGDLDLAVANGHMQEGVEELEPGLSYWQANQLLETLAEKDGRMRFRNASGDGGPAFTAEKVSRGLAAGDWNDDGRLDLLITNTNGAAELLEDRRPDPGHWLGIALEGPAANRFAIGARVELTAGGKRQLREVRSGGGFQPQSDLRLHFDLGAHAGPVSVEIRWSDGHLQRETVDAIDRYRTIRYRAK